MNQYTHYVPDGITDCDTALLDSAVADDLSNQACLLALARGKSSLIRVGGGENFGKFWIRIGLLFRVTIPDFSPPSIYRLLMLMHRSISNVFFN